MLWKKKKNLKVNYGKICKPMVTRRKDTGVEEGIKRMKRKE